MTERTPHGPGREAWRRLRRNRFAMAAAVVLIVLYAMALCAPFLAPYGETEIDRGHFFHPPTPLHVRDAEIGRAHV